jgi:hypothetical protein
MKPEQRHVSVAYLWLFSAGIDHVAVDTNGEKLVNSLATLLCKHERDGRRTAAALYLQTTVSGEHSFDDDDTGCYETGQLQSLLKKASRN